MNRLTYEQMAWALRFAGRRLEDHLESDAIIPVDKAVEMLNNCADQFHVTSPLEAYISDKLGNELEEYCNTSPDVVNGDGRVSNE